MRRDTGKQNNGLFGFLREKLFSFIPRRVGNGTVLRFFELFRRRPRRDWRGCRKNLMINLERSAAHTINGYIEDQESYGDMRYGKTTMKYAGCEVFAVFNALVSLTGRAVTALPELISAFENDGMVLTGRFGTSPRAMADYLERRGFKTRISTAEKDFDSLAESSESMILTMYNDVNDIRRKVHTVNISREPGGLFAHNVCGDGRVLGPCSNVSELLSRINGGSARGIALIGVNTKEE